MTNLVSIIVPVYNAERVLVRCLDSILTQSYSHIEVLLVNDGSTDQSGDICHHYAKLDQRVKVIQQKNAGPSAARNTGIQAASGTYIQFVDADDFIERDMTKELVLAVRNQAELVICGYKSVMFPSKDGEVVLPSITGLYDKSKFLEYFGELYQDIIIPSIWNKLYDKKTITKYLIRFTENVSMGEDLLFNLAFIGQCSHVYLLEKPLYNYVTSDNESLSRAFNMNFIQNQDMLYDEVKRFLIEQDRYTDQNVTSLNKTYAIAVVNGLNNLFHTQSHLTPIEQKKTIRQVISKNSVQKNLSFFTNSKQLRLMGFLMRKNRVNGVFWFLKFKYFLNNKMHPLFKLAKKLNYKD